MGFCSGTDIFDPVAKYVLESSLTDEQKSGVIRALIVALEDHDWDCQDDSAYVSHPIVQEVLEELHPDEDFRDWSYNEG